MPESKDKTERSSQAKSVNIDQEEKLENVEPAVVSDEKKDKAVEKPVKESIDAKVSKKAEPKKLDKETEKIRETVLKVLEKHPDTTKSTSDNKVNNLNKYNSKEVYQHQNIATLDADEDISVIDKLLDSQKPVVKIKKESKLTEKIKTLSKLVAKEKPISPEQSKDISEDTQHYKKIEEKKIKPTKFISQTSNNNVAFVMNKSGWLLFSLNLAITIVLLGGIILAVIGASVYKSSFLSEQATQSIVTVIPYPAGIVNSEVLTIAELRTDVAALNKYFSTQAEDTNWFGNLPDDEDVQSIVWERFVQNTLLFQIAKQYNLEVTDDMLQEQLGAIIKESGSEENFAARIALLYGWDVATFTERVIKPFVLREALSGKIFRDETLRQERINLAVQISTELRNNPAEFINLVEQYSEDDLTRDKQGETGFVNTNTLNPEISKAITLLDPDEISGVIESGEGYEIVQLIERQGNQVNIRKILIRYPTLELLLDQARARATIYRFVR